MATNMEQMQQGERFTNLDPPESADQAGFSESPDILPHRVWDWGLMLGAFR